MLRFWDMACYPLIYTELQADLVTDMMGYFCYATWEGSTAQVKPAFVEVFFLFVEHDVEELIRMDIENSCNE